MAAAPSRTVVVGDVAVTAADNALVATDAPTGKVLWTSPHRSRTAPVIAGGKIWAAVMCGMGACDLATGRWLGGQEWGWSSSPIVTDGSRVAYTNTHGGITLADAESREEIAVVEGALPGFPPMLAGNAMLYFAPGGIMRYDFETKKSSAWFPSPEWMGRPTSPMIMVKSNVYFATDKIGLVCIKPRR